MSADARQRLANLSDEDRRRLAERLAVRRRSRAAAGIPRRSSSSVLAPLSYAQQRFWFLTQMGTLGSAFNVLETNRLRGPLDVSAMQQAVAALVRRHESLRTTFEMEDGRPRQRVHAGDALTLVLEDLSSQPDPEAAARARGREEFVRPWDLERGPLFRAFLWRIAADDHLLFICVHHIVSDGWSKGVLVRDLAALYAAFSSGRECPLVPLPIQYADYAAWQQEWLRSDAGRSQLAYWQERMADAPTLQLPGRARDTTSGLHRWVIVPEQLTSALRAFCTREGVTPFIALVAVFAAQLSRYARQREVVIGSPFANRTRADVEGLIGCFMNPLPLRIDADPHGSFRALLRRAREACLGAVANQELPFDVLVRTVQPRRATGQAPLFQAMFLLHNMWQTLAMSGGTPGASAFQLPEDQLRAAAGAVVPGEIIYPVAVEIIELETVLAACFEYAREFTMFDGSPQHFLTLLEHALRAPDAAVGSLPMLPQAERRAVIDTARGGPASSSASVVLAFEARAAETPAAVALEQGTASITYAALNGRSNQLARRLRELGVERERFVGVLLDRSFEVITALVATLKAGGAYVPLDTASPSARLVEMARTTRFRVLVTTARDIAARPDLAAAADHLLLLDAEADAIAARTDVNLGVEIHPEQLAYVIFTSGSTGRPKGVAIRHGALAAYTASSVSRFGLTPSDRVLQFASIAFDTAGEEIYPALTGGATLVLRDPGVAPGPAAFLELCNAQRLTVLDLPTAYWDELTARMAAENRRAPADLRLVIIGGEKALAERAVQWAAVAPDVRLLNTYGPTEATIVCTELDVDTSAGPADVPIGRPVPGAEVYVLDDGQELVPAGVAGELYIGGVGLARGYVGDAATTADRFVPHPFAATPGARLYRSGDLARVLPDGTIEFMGRVDEQVKLRGFRIEPGEIATVLAELPEVAQALVLVREDQPGERRLVAYVVASPGRSATPSELREALKDRLPEYMVPSAFVRLDEFPVTTNGKIDRAALPVPDRSRETEHEYVAPRTTAELTVAAVWREVLSVDRVGAADNFFDLGGHSMLAMRVASRLSRDFGHDVSVRAIFETRTLADLAARLEPPVLAPAAADADVLEDEVVL